MKFKLKQPFYPKHKGETPQYQTPIWIEIEDDIPTEPTFNPAKVGSGPEDYAQYHANFVGHYIQSYIANLKGNHKDTYEHFILHNEIEGPTKSSPGPAGPVSAPADTQTYLGDPANLWSEKQEAFILKWAGARKEVGTFVDNQYPQLLQDKHFALSKKQASELIDQMTKMMGWPEKKKDG